MNRSPRLVRILAFFAVIVPSVLQAQYSTANRFIFASVQQGTGRVQVMLPPGSLVDPSLSFPDKSYFSCTINGYIYTNNDQGSLPLDMRGLPYLLRDAEITKIADTVRAVWKRDNVDIIQDVYPVLFPNSGQIVLRWSFINHQNSPIAIGCQYLNDIDISDPRDHSHHGLTASGDGPIILHKFGYYRNWLQLTDGSVSNPGVPPFYLGFLHDLPDSIPGLAGFGYLDNPSMGLIKPVQVTIGDWFTLRTRFWGTDPAWPTGSLGKPGETLTPGKNGGDVAVLLQFVPKTANQNKLVTVASTSYGTGEFQTCNGSMFGLLFYPDRLKWDKTTQTYSPNPFHVQVYAVNPEQLLDLTTGIPGQPAYNTTFTLTAGNNLTVVDGPPSYTPIGKYQTLPKTPGGMFLGPGDVTVLDWYLKADPEYFCQGDVVTDFKLTGTSSLDSFAFAGDTCPHTIILECAETDYDPPLYTVTTGIDTFYRLIDVHDDRPTDRGLKRIFWSPINGTPDSNFTISYTPEIRPCASDKDVHTITIHQIDSTIGGCFDFTFEDCLGHQSYTTVCLPAHPLIIYPDTLPPLISVIQSSGSYDGTLCNNRLDSIVILDNRLHDKGLESITITPSTTPVNMELRPSPVIVPSGSLISRISVAVLDSMLDGTICIRATDGAQNSTDTCISYCTIADTIAPRIEIYRNTKQYLWNVIVKEDTAWDRGIDSIYVINTSNVTYLPTIVQAHGARTYYFDVYTIDTTQVSGFCVYATDLAHNQSTTKCVTQTVGSDDLPPTIGFNPDPKTNPTVITVNVADLHFYDPPYNLDTVVWDTGVDSVWFTYNSGIITPPTIHNNCGRVVPPFVLQIADSLKTDSVGCVTINAVDCHGNLTTTEWCYPYKPDSLPPIIQARYLDKQRIEVLVTDARLYDRGLRSITSTNTNNLETFGGTINRLSDTSFILHRFDVNKSSYSTIDAVDYWGELSPAQIPTHSASSFLNVWIQNMAMKPGALVDQGATLDLPVYFIDNDTVARLSKPINDFAFSFTMHGDVSGIQFTGINRTGTATEKGWNVSATQNGSTVLIEGHRLPGGQRFSNILDTVVLLEFQSSKSEDNKTISLDIDLINNESIIYNNGRDSTYFGLNSTAIMPPPWGTLSGARIVVVGSCSPIMGPTSGTPSSTYIDVPNPNPAEHSTTIHYAIGNEGPVKLSIYDQLGREVKQIVNTTQKAGYYDLAVDLSDLTNGQYIIRFEAGGKIQTRSIAIRK